MFNVVYSTGIKGADSKQIIYFQFWKHTLQQIPSAQNCLCLMMSAEKFHTIQSSTSELWCWHMAW